MTMWIGYCHIGMNNKQISVDWLNYDELLSLHHVIVDRLNVLEMLHAHEKMVALGMGAKVSFDSNRGKQFGTIVKFNQKTVGVVSDEGRRWNVSPLLLTEVKEIKEVQVRPRNQNNNKNKKRKNRKKK